MYLTSASDSPTGGIRARTETSQRCLFEIGAACAVIVAQASVEGRDAGSERERSHGDHPLWTNNAGEDQEGLVRRDCRDACEGNMKEAPFLLLK